MDKHLLVIDIGNTNIVIGAFLGEDLLFEARLRTDLARTADEYDVLIGSLIDRRLPAGSVFNSCVISSVVPPVTPTIARLVQQHYRIEPLIVGPGVKTGLSIRVPDPSSVGSDRIVNAIAAKALFGAPALVIDFGTATSFDFVSRSGNYEGGIIAPGPTGALDSLVRNTAKLPRIEMSWPKTVIGNTTIQAMQSGAVVGYLCLVEGLIDRVIAEVGPIENIIATGGLGKLFSEHSSRIRVYDPQLTLKGLRLVASYNE